jgi:DNA-binding MarR family transcriptional regulator
MNKKRKLSNTEKIILETLYLVNRPLTTGEVSEMSHIAWVTASMNLRKLESKKYVASERIGNAFYWYILTERTRSRPPLRTI